MLSSGDLICSNVTVINNVTYLKIAKKISFEGSYYTHIHSHREREKENRTMWDDGHVT